MMRGARIAGIAAVSLALLSLGTSTAFAQTSRVRLTGALEFVHTTADDGGLGRGAGWSGGLEFALTPSTSVGFDAGAERYGRDSRFGVGLTVPGRPVEPYFYDSSSRGTAVYVMARIAHAFTSGSVRPMIFGGVGLMHDGGSTTRLTPAPGQVIPDSGQVPQFAAEQHGEAVSALASEGGAGFNVRVNTGLSIDPYIGFRFVRTGNAGPKYVVRSGAAVAVRW